MAQILQIQIRLQTLEPFFNVFVDFVLSVSIQIVEQWSTI